MARKATQEVTLNELKRSSKLTLEAQKKRLISYPTKCDFCPQDKGIIRLHTEDPTFILNVLPDLLNGTNLPDNEILVKINKCFKQLCYRCDMMQHSKALDPEAYSIYIQQLKDGVRFAPVSEHDYEILIKAMELGITDQSVRDFRF